MSLLLAGVSSFGVGDGGFSGGCGVWFASILLLSALRLDDPSYLSSAAGRREERRD